MFCTFFFVSYLKLPVTHRGTFHLNQPCRCGVLATLVFPSQRGSVSENRSKLLARAVALNLQSSDP